jgi:hypothetical protein
MVGIVVMVVLVLVLLVSIVFGHGFLVTLGRLLVQLAE